MNNYKLPVQKNGRNCLPHLVSDYKFLLQLKAVWCEDLSTAVYHLQIIKQLSSNNINLMFGISNIFLKPAVKIVHNGIHNKRSIHVNLPGCECFGRPSSGILHGM